MSKVNINPDSVTSIIDGLMSIFNIRSFIVFLSAFLLMFLLGYVGLYAGLGLSPSLTARVSYHPIYLIATALILSLAIFLGMMYLLEVQLLLAINRRLSPRYGLSSAFRTAIKYYLAFMVSTTMEFLVIFGGFILLVVPGFYIGVKTMFFNISKIREKGGLYFSLRRSNEITKGNFIPCFTVLLFYTVLSVILSYVITTSSVSLVYKDLAFSVVTPFILFSYTMSANTMFTRLNSNSPKTQKSRLMGRFLEADRYA